MKPYDILVVGAGPAGCTAAIRLAEAGLVVAIAERERFPRGKVCGDFVSAPSWDLLDALGVAEKLRPHAGPPVDSVGFFGGDAIATARMPGARQGRAIGRERLDAVLLEQAAIVGANIYQPAMVESITCEKGVHEARLRMPGRTPFVIRARDVIDAHGSVLRGPFEPVSAPVAGALFGFKAHFSHAALPRGLMPLVIFPGGYGGLVESEPGLVGFSCCIRGDALHALRGAAASAGEAVFAHVARHCRGFREALGGARLAGRWRGAGPIDPRVRGPSRPGALAVGNAAGEAHPLVAEGISMALQSAWLAAHHLASGGTRERVARAYERDWRAHFVTRIRAAQAFASLADRCPALMTATVRAFPGVLTAGAHYSGKSRPVSPRYCT